MLRLPLSLTLLALIALCSFALGCTAETAPLSAAVQSYCRDHDADAVERRIDAVLAALTLDEKARLMRGTFPLPRDGAWQASLLPDKGFPGFHMLDGPRGVSRLGGATGTAFPVAMLRGATWDPELEAEVGRRIALELRARGADTLLAPTINLLQHPLWGRAQETYGEDSFHVGALGTSFVLGAQEHVLCVVKHFAVNNIENTRLTVNVEVSERALREVFLPHFERVVHEGRVGAVMSAYNQVNGAYCSQNDHLLREILREDWEFAGLVMSDWLWGTHDTLLAIDAGLDLEMPAEIIYGRPLAQAVLDGEVRESQLDTALRRILRAQYCYSFDSNPPVLDPDAVETSETLAFAQRVAERGIVLLKNEGALPLARTPGMNVALVGPLVDVENSGDLGSSAVTPSEVVTFLEGMEAARGALSVTHVPGDLSAALDRDVVSGADAVVVVVGLDKDSEGEGNIAAGDRTTFSLPPAHLAVLTEALSLNDNVVVVLEGGSVLDVAPFVEEAEAVVMAWYPGAQGGHAIARVLFGDVNPSGRLPMAWPMQVADLPPFDSVSEQVTQGLFHGQRHLDREALSARYPLGFGLSYTSFVYESLRLESASLSDSGTLRATVRVRNSGDVDGDEVVQLYVSPPGVVVERAPHELRGFERVSLAAGQSADVVIEVPVADLAYYDTDANAWAVEPGEYQVHVGPNASTFSLTDALQITP